MSDIATINIDGEIYNVPYGVAEEIRRLEIEKDKHKEDTYEDVKNGISIIVAKTHYNQLVDVLKLAYRKWHLDDPDVGSEELSGILCDILCEAMTDKEFQKWSMQFRNDLEAK